MRLTIWLSERTVEKCRPSQSAVVISPKSASSTPASAIQFDERVADRVLPELEAFARGNIGRRQYGFSCHRTCLEHDTEKPNRFHEDHAPLSYLAS